jgi:hypothetical protein
MTVAIGRGTENGAPLGSQSIIRRQENASVVVGAAAAKLQHCAMASLTMTIYRAMIG